MVVGCLLVSGCKPSERKTEGIVTLVPRSELLIPQSEISTNWNPDTEDLDLGARYDETYLELDHAVTNFYNLLRKKDWNATYDLRWKTFRESITKETYINDGEKEMPDWQLANYDILSEETYNDDDALLICRFVELPGPRVAYSMVNWRKEHDGVWRCNVAGPTSLSLFRFTTYMEQPDE